MGVEVFNFRQVIAIKNRDTRKIILKNSFFIPAKNCIFASATWKDLRLIATT